MALWKPIVQAFSQEGRRRRTQEVVENTPAADDDDLDDDETTTTELVLALGLVLIMVGVGMSCRPQVFRKMMQSPNALQAAAVGVTCQFIIMPVVSYLLTLAFGLDGYTALGFLLVGCMPGGSSSNVFTMWAHGVLELSVFMTIVSTLLAFALTPMWLWIFAKLIDNVDDAVFAFDEIALTFALLIIPLAVGVSLNCWACTRNILNHVERAVSALAIVVFVAAIVVVIVENPNALQEYATWEVCLAGVIFFPLAATLSYAATTLLRFAPALRRTVVMEVGLQNLALGFAIGLQSVSTQSQLEQGLPFPIVYAISMYAWSALLVPVFRWQKQYNDRHGVQDNDPNFFLEESSAKEQEMERDNSESVDQEEHI